jgi:hypothetical protein
MTAKTTLWVETDGKNDATTVEGQREVYKKVQGIFVAHQNNAPAKTCHEIILFAIITDIF